MESFDVKLERTANRLGISLEQMPRNIAIIMDGNGRWAEERGLPRAEGHNKGGRTVETIALLCVDLGIETLTLYSFSIENWKRPKEEINALMHLYKLYLKEIRPTLMKNNVKLIHLGRRDGLPETVLKELDTTMEQTGSNSGMVLALALNYSGRVELVDATQTIAKKIKEGTLQPDDVDESCISRHLYTAEIADPDLLIRTANEMRISNFLLWQISYSEFYVTKTYWPDFTQESLEEAIIAYAGRTRRFGAVKTS